VDAEDLADAAVRWLLATAQASGAGLTWPDAPGDHALYTGDAGVALALLEAHHHFGDDRYAEAAVRGARTVATAVEAWGWDGFYFGLTGMAFVLHTIGQRYGEPSLDRAATRALDRVRSRFDGERWSEWFELLGGNAGIALGALALGDLELAELAVTPYLRRAESTVDGVNWETRSGNVSRLHHISHGTLGIVYALMVAGRALGRADLIELSLAGLSDMMARNDGGPEDFLVPHSDPLLEVEGVERYSYGWCHGPAGDAQVFRLLGPDHAALVDRCWHTVVHSGLPQRLRPGFWDNNGRCCGTAGVLAFANDRAVERDDGVEFAAVLVEDLALRATIDADGARWSNVEFRVEPSALPPRSGWAMGNAGIVRELLRYARITGGRDQAYAVTWPDHPPAADQ
jgi:lantibiotic modifying enzyme